VSDEKLWDESPTSRHLQVLYHQTSFQSYITGLTWNRSPEVNNQLITSIDCYFSGSNNKRFLFWNAL